MVHIPIVVEDNPPHGIGADTTHPPGQRGYIPSQIQAFWHHFVVTKDCIYCSHLGMEVAHPYQPVSLNTIPKVVLHIKMDRIGSRFPDFVEALITARKRT